MSKTVLIVDDSSVMRMTVINVLKEAGYTMVEASDGLNALEKLSTYKVDLIISDVNMPNMDGLTFVKKVKELPDYKFIPIIMLTTVTGQDKIEIGKAAGIKAWMVKPFDKNKLIGAVSKLLGQG
jgi:two-component system chemotaxis response regulator CheY